MTAQFAGQDQRNWDEKWPEIMLAVNTSTSESIGHTPAFLTQCREPRLPSSLYDKETLGTGRATETPEENANKLREVFEIVRRHMEKVSQDQARHYNLRRRQWSPAVDDIVWANERHLSKAAEGFAAKLAPRYDGPYQVVLERRTLQWSAKFPTHSRRKKGQFTLASSSNNKTSRQQKRQMSNNRYEATGLGVRPKRESTIRHTERTIRIAQDKEEHRNVRCLTTGTRPQDYASGLSESHPHATQKGQP